MIDRKLLESAARVAGISGDIKETAGGAIWLFRDCGASPWNPLVDDGDALRLAVKLRLLVEVDIVETIIDGMLGDQRRMVEQPHDGDEYAATRRAIVRAAAELEKRAELKNG